MKPLITTTDTEAGVIIVMADGDMDDQAQVKKAARACDIPHVFASVYNGVQLIDLLFKRDVYFSESKIPDLLIMDINLRLLDGFEALKQIKSDDVLKEIPIYILTHNYTEEGAKRAKELGACHFFKKPLTYDELHLIIKGICDLHFKDKKRIVSKNSNSL